MFQEKKEFPIQVTSAMLHILAMLFMLSDHLWGTLMGQYTWMTCIGRIAFPIFAFMIVEGYFYTHNFKKYVIRLLVAAILTEVPFDLMHEGIPFYPFHQNVLWIFIISLLGIHLMEKIRRRFKIWAVVPLCALVVLVCVLLGFVTFADYYGPGVLIVFLFYFFRGRKWWCYAGQLIGLYLLTSEVMGGRTYLFHVFGTEIELVQECFALLALIPIWLYRGKQGYHSKWFQYFCYAFYPVHALLLYLVGHFFFR